MILAVCLLCFQGSGQDTKKGMTGLIHATPNGKRPLKIAQMFSAWILTLVIASFLYGSNLILTVAYAGPENLSVALQSITDFRNTIFSWSIREYLIVFLVWKLLGSCLTATLCQFISTLFSGGKTAWVLLGVLYGISFLQWLFIPDHPVAKVFRYLNPFGIQDAGQILGNYQNLNFFTLPVGLLSASTLYLLLGTIGTVTITMFIPSTTYHLPALNLPYKEHHRSRSSVWYFEFYKTFVNQKAWIIIVFMVLASIWTTNSYIRYVGPQEYCYNLWIQKYQGTYTPEKAQMLKKQLETENNLTSNEEIALERISSQMENIQENLDGFGGILNEDQLMQFFFPEDIETQNLLLLLIAMILTLSPLFFQERKNGMLALIRSTPKNKSIYWSKMGVAASTGILYSFILWLPYYIRYFRKFGAENLNFSIQSYTSFAELKLPFSIGGYMIFTMLLRLIMGGLLGVLLALFCQYLTSPALNIMGNLIVFGIPACLLIVGNLPYQNPIVTFISLHLKGKLGYIRIFSSWNQMFSEGTLPGGLWILLLTVILSAISWNFYQQEHL